MQKTLPTLKFNAIVALMALLIMSAGQAFAQKKNGSRLEINQTSPKSSKKTALVFENGRSVKPFGKPQQLNFDPKVTGASKQYFSKLLTSQNQKTIADTETAKTTLTEAPKVSTNTKAITEKIESKDLFFSNEAINVSNVYPNPVDQFATFNYNVSGNIKTAKIEIYNVLGSSTNNGTNLDRFNKKAMIDCRSLSSGIYFYQLILNGKTVATKKLLIRHSN
jgi:hypothetical protein